MGDVPAEIRSADEDSRHGLCRRHPRLRWRDAARGRRSCKSAGDLRRAAAGFSRARADRADTAEASAVAAVTATAAPSATPTASATVARVDPPTGTPGANLNVANIMAEQVLPLSTIVFFSLLIIYVLFRLGWLRTKRDLFIVMLTGVMVAYLVLSLVGSFFRGQSQALIWPWEVKVDPG